MTASLQGKHIPPRFASDSVTDAERGGGPDVEGQGVILDVVDGGSIFLLLVSVGNRIAEQVVEPRHMRDIVAGEGLRGPWDLVGRQVELSEDGMSLSFL